MIEIKNPEFRHHSEPIKIIIYDENGQLFSDLEYWPEIESLEKFCEKLAERIRDLYDLEE